MPKVYIKTFGWPSIQVLQYINSFLAFSSDNLMHRPALAPWTVALAGLRGWCFHRSPQLGLRLTASLAGPLAHLAQSLCSDFSRWGGFRSLRSEPAKPSSWCNRSVVMIPFLRHPLSSGFVLRTKFFYNRKIFFNGGGEKRIKPSSSRRHRQGMFCLEYKAKHPANIPRPPKPLQSGGFNRLWRFSLRPLCVSFPLKRKKIPKSTNTSVLFCKRPEQSATPKDIPSCGGKTFALRIRVALMNIWVISASCF